MHSKLSIEVGKGEEGMRVVETALILAMAAFHFAIVAWRVGTDQLVAYAKSSGRFLKEGDQFALGISESIGKLKAIVGLYTFDGNATLFEEGVRLLQKVGRGIGALLLIGSQVAQPGEFINGSVLE
jgi:hypothetical protein